MAMHRTVLSPMIPFTDLIQLRDKFTTKVLLVWLNQLWLATMVQYLHMVKQVVVRPTQ